MSKGAKIGLVLLLVMVLAVAGGVALWAISRGASTSIADKTILEIDFTQPIIEHIPEDPLASLFMEDEIRMLDVIRSIERAAEDDRVVGMIARVGSPGGFANLQELRDAIQLFRDSGKTAVAYSDTFGEFGPGNGGYYLASAFDEIYIQPSGDVGLTGLMAEGMFLTGALEKLDVTPRMDHRYEYKNAMNSFTEKEFTPAHEEALGKVVESIFDQMVRGIAAGRGLSEDEVRQVVDEGPYLGQEAVDSKLVDGLLYRNEVYDLVKERAGDGAELLYLDRYHSRARKSSGGGEEIALIYGVGAVTRGQSNYDAFGGSATLGGDSVAAAFRSAIEDDDVKAILFRVDSPGGSYIGSDTVWHETRRAREAGKPVIVSMGNVAGSGGYFVAMAADKIVAEPGTITGSIGVFAGKLVTRGLWNKLGFTFDELHTSENADMWSPNQDYDEAGWSRVQAMLDRIYADFTQKVADGREMPLEQVQEIAKGRIWSGEDALEIGLVDALGGYRVAIDLAREAAGIDADEPIRLKEFPRPKTTWELLFEDQTANNSEEAARVAAIRMVESLRPTVQLLRQTGILGPQAGVLTMTEQIDVR